VKDYELEEMLHESVEALEMNKIDTEILAGKIEFEIEKNNRKSLI